MSVEHGDERTNARMKSAMSRLADDAPMPDTWPALGDEALRPRRRFSRSWSLGRPRRPVAVGIVVAAALCMVVAAVVLRAGVNGTTGSTRTAAEPGATALGGHWDPNGPRLTDAQLGSIIRVITLSDGTTTYQPRAQMNLSGGAKFDARRVIGVSVARATPESFTKEFLPRHAENLTSAQRAAIMKYLRVLPSTTSPSATSGSSSDVRTMAIVESVPAGSKPTCGQPSDADGLACAPGRLDIVWMFLGDSSAPVDRYSISTRSEDDYLLAGFDSVGHWAPGNSRAATVSPGQSATTATVPGTSSTPPPGSTTSTP